MVITRQFFPRHRPAAYQTVLTYLFFCVFGGNANNAFMLALKWMPFEQGRTGELVSNDFD
jgi:hypothetical protein